MSGRRYTKEFKIEAVKQVVDRGYKAREVAERLGVTYKSLYDWINGCLA
jgi:transposase